MASPLPVVSALKTDSTKILPSENDLESGSSQLALDSIVSTDKTDSSPVSVGVIPPHLLKGLKAADLARRLKVDPSRIAQKKNDPDFAVWSAKKDPDGLEWVYDSGSKMFFPRLPSQRKD